MKGGVSLIPPIGLQQVRVPCSSLAGQHCPLQQIWFGGQQAVVDGPLVLLQVTPTFPRGQPDEQVLVLAS
ncbi:MAG: hypothetical protein DLM72_03790 [Candidatus Nitrosopolaris wilkensis]|nr:MAG: hypothetical protein DLM72_03790 [Candidatus Nitrosopolaris wilkensis]